MDDVKLNSNCVNAKIKAVILSDNEMKNIGFTDYVTTHWYYFKELTDDITFNVHIPKDGSDIDIYILDEEFGQPYDYQYILENNPTHPYALKIQELVEDQMTILHDFGVIQGHIYGEYI